MYELHYVAQVLLAVVLGGIIGLQRERWGKKAGPRTYALVGGGAALFTIASLTSFGPTTAAVAAAVVSGVGFLCAGSILHREDRVEGLTTAAGIWMVAAIGMAIGVEKYILGISVALIALIVLMLDDSRFKVERTDKK